MTSQSLISILVSPPANNIHPRGRHSSQFLMGEHFQIKIRSDHQHIPGADNAVFRTYLVWVARLFEIGPVWPVKQPRGQLRVTSPSLQLYSFNDAGSEGIMQRRNAGNPEAARANVRVGHIPIIPVS